MRPSNFRPKNIGIYTLPGLPEAEAAAVDMMKFLEEAGVHQDAQGGGLLLHQAAGGDVGGVAQGTDGGLDTGAGQGGDVRLVIDDARDGFDRAAGQPGHMRSRTLGQ